MSVTDLSILAVGYLVSGFGVTVGFHRCFTHGSFKATRWLRVVLAVTGSLAIEGSVTQWVADHRRHHAFSDRDGDPHSPWRYGRDTRGLAKGMLYAHCGWLLNREPSNRERFAPDLLADPDIRRVERHSLAWAVVTMLSWAQVVLLVAVTAVNVVSYWCQLVASLPGLSLGQAAVNNQTATSMANTVPGGGVLAIGVACLMLRSWGFSAGSIALSVVLTGVWNAFLRLALPILAVAVLAVSGTATGALLLPALIGLSALTTAVALAGLVLRRDALARQIGGKLGAAVSWLRRLVHKPPVSGWADAGLRFRHQSTELVARRWPALTITTAVSHLSL